MFSGVANFGVGSSHCFGANFKRKMRPCVFCCPGSGRAFVVLCLVGSCRGLVGWFGGLGWWFGLVVWFGGLVWWFGLVVCLVYAHTLLRVRVGVLVGAWELHILFCGSRFSNSVHCFFLMFPHLALNNSPAVLGDLDIIITAEFR